MSEINWVDTILVFLGGLGFFFFGMKQLSNSLQAVSGDLIKKVLSSLTSNRILGVAVGTFLTMLVQSSSVMTVMAVGFVNAGLMTLYQSICIIFGANIGTTITGWIISLKIGKYGVHMVGLGGLPMLFLKNDKIKAIAGVVFALGLIFFGLETMSGAFKPLRTDPGFQSFLTYFAADSIPSLIGTVIMGCILTMIIQSSSAMLGITMALATTGSITFQTAAALVLGENIGTTVTALLASIGTTTNAKRTAYAHMTFNLTAVFLLLLIFWPYVGFIEWLIPGTADAMVDGEHLYVAKHIAASHTIFNVTATIMFVPFIHHIARFVTWLAPEPKDGMETEKLELLGNPSQIAPALAIEQAYQGILKMARLTQKQLVLTREYVLDRKNGKAYDKVEKYEDISDNMQKELLEYLCSVMSQPLNTEASHKLNAMISIADDLESMADYANTLVRFRKRLHDNNHEMLDDTKKELEEYIVMIEETFSIMLGELEEPDSVDLHRFDRLVKSLKDKSKETRERHLERIKGKKYKPLSGLTYSDMVNCLRKFMGHMAGVNKAVYSFVHYR